MEQAARHFIEVRNARGLVNRSAALTAVFADAALLGSAEAFICTAASLMSRLLLLALVGRTGSVPPFALLDRPLAELWYSVEEGEPCAVL